MVPCNISSPLDVVDNPCSSREQVSRELGWKSCIESMQLSEPGLNHSSFFSTLRSLVGLGEAVAPTSVVDMIARCVPKEERSSAVSLAFTGQHIGSMVGLLASPALIQCAGWRSLFIVFGSTGLIWFLGFEGLMAEVQKDDPETAAKLTASMTSSSNSGVQPDIPYRAFIREPAIQALCFTHFVNNW